MVRRTALVVALVSGACIKLKDFNPGTGSGSPDAATADAAPAGMCGNGLPNQATASMSGTAICAAGPGYVLRFPATSFHYPDQLHIGTADVLGTSTACAEESLIGMVAFPMSRFASDSSAIPDQASATIILGGPVVSKVVVNWSQPLVPPCASSGAVTGLSTFTLFPDGRLIRYDQLTTPSLMSQNCDCDGTGLGFYLTSYVTFTPTVTITKQTGEVIPSSSGGGTMLDPLVCASANGWTIAIAEQLVGRVRDATGGGIAVTSDIDGTGSTSLSAGTRGTLTAYQIGNDMCAKLLAPIAQFMNVTGPQLHVQQTASGFDTTIGTGRDGIYGGDDGMGNGLPTGGPGALTLTTTDTIPPGWALWVSGLTFGQPSASPSRSGEWFKIQTVAGGSIIWFRDGLGAGDTITVPAS